MKIEQFLHGYYKGHGLLASSVSIASSTDSTLMSVLSDWTGYHVTEADECGYLTAYPLSDGKLYAVAKSWYASEMERPGCVWTHTMVVNLEELDKNFDFRQLNRYFKRPHNLDFSQYRETLEIEFGEDASFENIFSEFDETTLLFLYTYLLSSNNIGLNILIEKRQELYQQLCLLYMQYLPLYILKKKSFSTGAESPRKLGNSEFTMQFVTAGRCISFSAAPWKEKLIPENFNEGLRFILNEAKKTDDETPSLIRIFSKDIGDSIDRFVAVCNLLRLLENATSGQNENYKMVLEILVSSFPAAGDGVLLKKNFLSRRITKLFCSEEDFLYYLASLNSLDAFDSSVINFRQRTMMLSDENPKQFISLVTKLASIEQPSDAACSVLLYSLEVLDEAIINDIVDNHWNTMNTLAGVSIHYMNTGSWIYLSRAHFQTLLLLYSNQLLESFYRWDELLDRILETETLTEESLSHMILKKADNAVIRILNYANNLKHHFLSPFLLQSCVKYEWAVLDWLARQSELTDTVERFIVFKMNPTSVNIKKTLPNIWLPFVNKDNGEKYQEYYVFLFILAHNWQDDYAVYYLHRAFYPLHEFLRTDSLFDREWQKIKRYTEPLFMQEWDKCKKLRKGLVKYLMSCGYNRSVLDKFTPDIKLNKQLKKIWDD